VRGGEKRCEWEWEERREEREEREGGEGGEGGRRGEEEVRTLSKRILVIEDKAEVKIFV
jgi:hypothetical protein